MAVTCAVFLTNEDDVVKFVRDHAISCGFSQLVPTEDWPRAVRETSRTLTAALDSPINPIAYRRDPDYVSNYVAEFGIREARLYRDRGVTLAAFIGLMKCFREGYLDFVESQGRPEAVPPAAIHRFFDWVEMGICAEWAAHKRSSADAELKRSISLLNATLDSTPDGILVVGLDGSVSSFNRKFQQMWRIPDDLIATKSDNELLEFVLNQVKDPEQFVETVRAMYADHELVSSDRLEFADGRIFERHSQPQRLGSRVVGRVWVFRDVTHQTQIEAQLVQAQRMQSIGRLAGGVAHDFNNLLTVINGHTSLLLEHTSGAPAERAGLEEIRKAGERAAGLTQQLLAFSRRQILAARALDLNHLVGSMKAMLVQLIDPNIELVFRPEPKLGEVRADRAQLEQVLIDLVINARDAMPDGGSLIIETSSAELDEGYAQAHSGVKPGRYAMLAVSDTGNGMDERTRALIFEPLFSTQNAGRGRSGIGLATVYGIVKQSGGSVWVYSEPGRGSTFKIYLPLAESTYAAAPSPEPGKSCRGMETVLIAEDQDQLRDLAATILQSFGYQVILAASAEQALSACEDVTEPIHLLLTDVVMPGLSGPELAARIRERRKGVKILYMSGYTEDMALRQGVLDSEVDYIQKPFTPTGLAEKVRMVLDSPGPQRRILLADDDPAVRGFLKAVLDAAGYEVLEAGDGDQALAAIRSRPVDLAVMDLVMPNREGMETIHLLRREFPDLKMIAVSGAFGGRFLHTAGLLGAHATLAKPIAPEKLVSTVRSLLEE